MRQADRQAAAGGMGVLGDGEPPLEALAGPAIGPVGGDGDDAEERARLEATIAALESESLLDDPEARRDSATSILDVAQGMGALFHEHLDAVLAWPWKLFCAQWRRMIAQSAKRTWDDRKRDAERDAQREREQAERGLDEASAQAWSPQGQADRALGG